MPALPEKLKIEVDGTTYHALIGRSMYNWSDMLLHDEDGVPAGVHKVPTNLLGQPGVHCFFTSGQNYRLHIPGS